MGTAWGRRVRSETHLRRPRVDWGPKVVGSNPTAPIDWEPRKWRALRFLMSLARKRAGGCGTARGTRSGRVITTTLSSDAFTCDGAGRPTAAADTLTHLAMLLVDDESNPATWDEHVSDEEYSAAPASRDRRSRASLERRTRGRRAPAIPRLSERHDQPDGYLTIR